MNYTENFNFLVQDAGDAGYATDANFLIQLPFWIQSAEDRILRDLDILNTYVDDDTGQLSQSRRLYTLPTDQGQFQLLSTIRLSPPGSPMTVSPPLEPVTREALDTMYPGNDPVGIPRYWAPFNQLSIMVGPAPDKPYQTHCYGVIYPASLNTQSTLGSASQGTFISNTYPDLFHAAQMVLVSAWERQFSAMADQPDSAMSWEAYYKNILQGTNILEARRRVAAAGWSTHQPEAVSSPQQT